VQLLESFGTFQKLLIAMKYVLDTIRSEGPKKARDFENETKKAGSWCPGATFGKFRNFPKVNSHPG